MKPKVCYKWATLAGLALSFFVLSPATACEFEDVAKGEVSGHSRRGARGAGI